MAVRVVLPGEEVAVTEEYEAGDGTYEEDGKVFAAQPGTRCHAVRTGEELFGALERPFAERALP